MIKNFTNCDHLRAIKYPYKNLKVIKQSKITHKIVNVLCENICPNDLIVYRVIFFVAYIKIVKYLCKNGCVWHLHTCNNVVPQRHSKIFKC